MTTEFQTDASVSKANMDTINIGNRLKAKRLELEFDERYVATELKIPIDQVRALEANNFSYFRSVTFARGFLKSYCRLLGIDPSEILNAFDAERADAETTIKPVDKVNKQSHLGDPIVIFISVVIIAVLVFLVFWWPSQTNNTPMSNDSQNGDKVEQTAGSEDDVRISKEPIIDEPNDSIAVEDKIDAQLNQIPKATSEQKTEVKSSQGQQEVDESNVVSGLSEETMEILEEAGVKPEDVIRANAEAPAELAAAPKLPSYSDEVEMTFDADCWTEVRDSSGKILFSGVKSANSTLSLNGKAPYRVVLGYAKGVSSLKYKGEEFDFSSFTRKDLARFELK
ncbi:RodZ domain-containing protein [Marinomonas rhizomae]|uniref:RodZ domain-containing protein n=1 Tax=Marinomonas rhizomae TaxID=491948 RepID=UPI002107785E|nr:RodZ domain-containing protein [Marinomonas rhizomae]